MGVVRLRADVARKYLLSHVVSDWTERLASSWAEEPPREPGR